MGQSDFCEALERALEPGGDLYTALDPFDDYEITTEDDALALCAAVARLERLPTSEERYSDLHNGVHRLISFFQQVGSAEAGEVLATDGIDELCRLFDAAMDTSDRDDDLLMFVLKMLAGYGRWRGLKRVVGAACMGFNQDDFMWSIVFGALGNVDDPEKLHAVCDRLASPLADGFLGVAFLDFANQIAIDGMEDFGHPFDTEEGRDRLAGFLRNHDEEEFSYAVSAAAALPFLQRPHRDELFALAMDHPDPEVQLEAAWAAARGGAEGGVKILARLALDARMSERACCYLDELGLADAIPEEAQDPDFQAMAALCAWLAHPNEYGRPPDDMEMFDSRRLYWPPTDDRRWVWLFRYVYAPDEDGDEEDDVGIGMVGSVTFALFGETTAEMTPEEIYGLHCCWELEMNDDPRATKHRDGHTGWQIIEAGP